MRDLAIGQLRVQERLRNEDFTLHKVLGAKNPADSFTKFVPRHLLDQRMATIALAREAGRAETTPHVASGA